MESDVTVNKSTFVTVVAWIFIIISGGMTLMSALQNIMIQTMMPDDMFNQSEESAKAMANAPWFAEFMFNHFQLIIFLSFVVMFVTFVASIGLLKRKNWGRYIIIGLLGLGIAWNVAGLAMQQSVKSEMMLMQERSFEQMEEYERKEFEREQTKAEEDPCCEKTDPCCKKPLTWEERKQRLDEQKARMAEFDQKGKSMMTIITIVSIIFALIFSAIEGWIIWKLTRPEIVAEF